MLLKEQILSSLQVKSSIAMKFIYYFQIFVVTHEDGSAPKELNELLISHLRRGAVIVDLVA